MEERLKKHQEYQVLSAYSSSNRWLSDYQYDEITMMSLDATSAFLQSPYIDDPVLVEAAF